MLDLIKNFFKKDLYLTFIVISFIILVIVGLFHICTKKSGTWSKYFFVPDVNYESSDKYKIQNRKKDSSGETECRRVLQEIFKVPFGKARPDFLSNPVTGGDFNLELDCYNPELNLAVEYNGQQHYKFIPFFHKNKESFLNQKYRDELKRRMCNDNMITLIEVPYTVKTENIKKFLLQELFKRGYIVRSS